MTENHKPLPGEIPFKLWIAKMAERGGVSFNAAYNRFYRNGPPPGTKIRRVNPRVVFVREATAK